MTEQAHVGAPVLEAENLSIQFGGLKALQELSFSIPEKTVFSIIGPNGAGKTTFFNIVTGIYRPTGGDVRLYGESIVGLEPSRIVERGVCRTFQNIRLFQNLTVLENVMIGRQLHERTGLGDILLRTQRFRAQEAETLDRAAEILDYGRFWTTRTRWRRICRTAASGGWKSRGRWPPRRACSCSTSRQQG